MMELTTLQQRFGAVSEHLFRGQRTIVIPSSSVATALAFLRSDGGFDMLADMTAVDYLDYPEATDRFGVVYLLANTATGERLTIKTFVNPPEPKLTSAYSLWRGSDWLEREVYDMFGIVFEGHPDLRRILMPDEFVAYPLRKDYPLKGRGERHNFPVITRAES
ncbi:MAG: NADH-quinone oxidoreductase subunit C [Planctomycetaceae bacterium]